MCVVSSEMKRNGSIMDFYEQWKKLGEFRIIHLDKTLLLQEYNHHTCEWEDRLLDNAKQLIQTYQNKKTVDYEDVYEIVKNTLLMYVRDIRYRRAKINRLSKTDKCHYC
jgi:hypothetical protein